MAEIRVQLPENLDFLPRSEFQECIQGWRDIRTTMDDNRVFLLQFGQLVHVALHTLPRSSELLPAPMGLLEVRPSEMLSATAPCLEAAHDL